MVHLRRHPLMVVFLVTSIFTLLLFSNLVAFAQKPPNPIRFVRSIEARYLETGKLNLSHPAGLAYTADSDEFVVIARSDEEGDAQSSLALLNRFDEVVATQPLLDALDLLNVAYDSSLGRILLFNPAENQLLALPRQTGATLNLDVITKYRLQGRNVQQPQGMVFDIKTGSVYLLDAQRQEIVAYHLSSQGGVTNAEHTIKLAVNGNVQLRGLAIHPATGQFMTLDSNAHLLYAFSGNGALQETYDLAQAELINPQGLAFAPSTDSTDDPAAFNLFIADSGSMGDGTGNAGAASDQPFSLYLPMLLGGGNKTAVSQTAKAGNIVEISLESPLSTVTAANALTATTTITGTLVRIIDTGVFSSPDPSGIAYIAPSAFVLNANRLMIVDGEVEEMSLYRGANMFEVDIAGQLVATYTTHPEFSSEPVGAAFNAADGHLFISDDDKRSIFEIAPGPDKLFRTVDDTRTRTLVTKFGGRDAEGVAFGLVGGITPTLFMADGINSEVWVIQPGADALFGGDFPDDVVTHFDSKALDVTDPEGIEFNPANRHIYLVGAPEDRIAELTIDGILVQYINITAANAVKPAGLALAPSSQNPGIMNLYIVDRGIDNSKDKNENDGKVYEIALPIAGNQPPQVNAGLDQTITHPASATLTGSAIDDGLPNPPGAITIAWSKMSGPGAVTLGNANQLSTTVSFSQVGIYTLRLTVSDSEYTAVDDVKITVLPQNQTPLVNAGPDQTVLQISGANLNATITDDGLPNPPALVTVTWSLVSGPGNVVFANPNAMATLATFTTIGNYQLRITASDSLLSASDDVTITVKLDNALPTVDLGVERTLAKNEILIVGATVTDDGLPNPPAALTYQWEKVNGPGTVTFSPTNQPTTSVTFGAIGVYTLRLTVNDSKLSAKDDLIITVTPANTAPIVNAGEEQTISLNESATLSGSASDDGFPNPPKSITVEWQLKSGPGLATFANPTSLQTTVSFSTPGIYVIRLTASDSKLTASDDVDITVKPANQAPSVNAGADRSINEGATAALAGLISDDGLPNPPSALTITWAKKSGPGNVSFGAPNTASTSATFSAPGDYILSLTVSDSQLSTTDEVMVTVAANKIPVVLITSSTIVTITSEGESVPLSATVDDDDPINQLVITWSKESGPGKVTFTNPKAVNTTVSFEKEGEYRLKLTISDGLHTSEDTLDISVKVNPGGQGQNKVFIPMIQW